MHKNTQVCMYLSTITQYTPKRRAISFDVTELPRSNNKSKQASERRYAYPVLGHRPSRSWNPVGGKRQKESKNEKRKKPTHRPLFRQSRFPTPVELPQFWDLALRAGRTSAWRCRDKVTLKLPDRIDFVSVLYLVALIAARDTSYVPALT